MLHKIATSTKNLLRGTIALIMNEIDKADVPQAKCQQQSSFLTRQLEKLQAMDKLDIHKEYEECEMVPPACGRPDLQVVDC